MALDHVRDLMHVDSANSPTNLLTTTPVLFFTRAVTYLCAPAFVFLAGASVYLSFQKQKNISATRSFLIKRGLWLILLEFTLVNFGLFFDAGFHTLIFEVIATIGVGFIVLGLLLHLPARSLGIIGLLIICCHNLSSYISFGKGSILQLLLSPGAIPLSSGFVFIMAYPPIPWLGIMLVGFATGKLFMLPEEATRKRFLMGGVSALTLFVLLRAINVYGDAAPWSQQKSGAFTFLSFLNVTKYPPSLLFCLLTLGILFLIFAFTRRSPGSRAAGIVSVYGKVPMFYFLIHFYLIHLALLFVLFLQGFGWTDLDFSSGAFGRPKGVQSGLPLWAVYLVWIAVVVILYKPCKWFARYKASHTYQWLRYI